MKNIKLLLILLGLCATILLNQSCTEDPCDDIVCQNGGTCDTGDCDCPDGFSGTTCEIQDLCFGITCEYDGVCVEGTCECSELNSTFIVGSWKVVENGTIISFLENGDWTNDNGVMAQWQITDDKNTIEILFNSAVIETFTIVEGTFSCETFEFVDSYNENATLIRE